MHGLSENILRKIKRSLGFWLAAALVIASDQLTKAWVLDTLAPGPEVSVIPNFFRFKYAENTGAAFSMFANHPGILTVIASLLALGVVVWSFLLPDNERLSRISLGLIFGGAVGNLIDRFLHSFVVDFLEFHWNGRQIFPTFNIADSSICIGIGIFFLSSYLVLRQSRKDPVTAAK